MWRKWLTCRNFERRSLEFVNEPARPVIVKVIEYISEFKRQKEKPNWDVVRSQISGPLLEVRDRVNEELARRESKDALVPIDRDPVPAKYSELVKRYYEKLGSEK